MDASTNALNWDDVRFFLAAFRETTLSGAAVELGVAQATMSRRIAGLEDKVGHVLFDRTRGGLEATEAALLLVPHAESMAAAAIDAVAELTGLEREPEGVVRLAVPPGVAFDLVPALLPLLRAKVPLVRLEVLAGNHYVDLVRRDADIAVRAQRPEHQDLVFRRLPAIQISAYATEAYAASLPDAYTAADVDWIQYHDAMLHIPTAQWVERHRGTRAPVFRSDNFLTMREVARAGIGAMLLPAPQGDTHDLVRLTRIPVELPDLHWYLVLHHAMRQVPRIRAVIEVLNEVVEMLDEGIDLRV